MDPPDIDQDPPRKRQKLSPSIEISASVQVPSANADDHQLEVDQPSLQVTAVIDPPISEESLLHQVPEKLQEAEVGITEYVSARMLRFSGILKKR